MLPLNLFFEEIPFLMDDELNRLEQAIEDEKKRRMEVR
jgi:hypothetical protein